MPFGFKGLHHDFQNKAHMHKYDLSDVHTTENGFQFQAVSVPVLDSKMELVFLLISNLWEPLWSLMAQSMVYFYSGKNYL